MSKHPVEMADLSAYHDNALRESERRRVEQHLAVCPSCREKLADYAWMGNALRAIPEPPVPLAVDVRVRALLRAEPRPSPRRWSLPPLWAPRPALAAVVLASLLIVALLVGLPFANYGSGPMVASAFLYDDQGAPAIEVKFDTSVDQSSVAKSVQIEPAVKVDVSWRSDNTMVVKPTQQLQPSEKYTLKLKPKGAESAATPVTLQFPAQVPASPVALATQPSEPTAVAQAPAPAPTGTAQPSMASAAGASIAPAPATSTATKPDSTPGSSAAPASGALPATPGTTTPTPGATTATPPTKTTATPPAGSATPATGSSTPSAASSTPSAATSTPSAATSTPAAATSTPPVAAATSPTATAAPASPAPTGTPTPSSGGVIGTATPPPEEKTPVASSTGTPSVPVATPSAPAETPSTPVATPPAPDDTSAAPTATPSTAANPSATPAPLATATPSTTPTPAPDPIQGLGMIFQANPTVAESLGAARATEVPVQLTRQTFERGTMLSRSDTREVFVLQKDGTWLLYRDSWLPGDPSGDAGPLPPGLLAPIQGLGKLWRQQADLRQSLGWATAPEQSLPGLAQEFAAGHVLETDDHVIYILYQDGSWQSFPDPSPTPTASETPAAP